MEKLSKPLMHLFITVFFYNISHFMVIPAITDVTMAALCPGKDECSIAIYLSALQQAIIGMGTLVMMPLIGNLSDTYGRKLMLTIPMTLAILPLVILAYSRTKYFFYAYYVLRTLTAMASEGTVLCIAFAVLADYVAENRRASAFGILSGITSSSFVIGNLSTRFLSTSSAFKVAASVAIVAAVYMRIFFKESIGEVGVPDKESAYDCLLEKRPTEENSRPFRKIPFLNHTISLLRSSSTFSQAAIVAFFSSLGEVGIHASMLYYLKARFHFNKDQFADLMVISGLGGALSQMILVPMLAIALTEENLLSLGLFFCFAQLVLYSIAWSSWVPYLAAVFSVLAVFAMPCMRSIVSKQVGPTEQGKAQGFIMGICSFSNVVSPLIFSPLTALFLSDAAPFRFPGFSIMCTGFAVMIAFGQSLFIRANQNHPNFVC